MLSWMPELEKRIAEYCAMTEDMPHAPHCDFRLWLSASPSPKFPIAILQRGIKMTTEPPRGLRANMLKLYNLVGEEQFGRCQQRLKYQRLLFSLCWFHALLLERRKFKSLGFNVPYEFNESDYSICHDLVIVFLDEYPDETPSMNLNCPFGTCVFFSIISGACFHFNTRRELLHRFDAMRYLIAEANYGGRVTDAMDRRLVNVYITQLFCEQAISPQTEFNLAPQLSDSPYIIPNDADLASAKLAIKTFPQLDNALAFGQHANADIASQIEDSSTLLDTIVSLQPKVIDAGGESKEQKILRICHLMQEEVPPSFDAAAVRRGIGPRADPEPMKTATPKNSLRIHRALIKSCLHYLLISKWCVGAIPGSR